jgi:CheY-like chemotaxis protein
VAESKTILIFSEDYESCQLYRACAAEKQYQIVFKEKKINTLRILSSQKFDLIIDEIHKPIISEIDFFDMIHKMANGTPITIISEFFYETKNIIFSNKPYAFILKPISLEKIIDHFEDIFESDKVREILDDTESPEKISLEAKKLSVLLEVSKRINSKTDIDILLESVIDVLTETLNSERATLFMLDKDKSEIWSRIGTRIKNKEIRFPAGKGIAGWVIETGTSQIIDDAYYHPRFIKDIDNQTGFITRNILCVPIKNLQGDIVGAFEMLNKKSGTFDKSDEDFLNILAVSIGIAIENLLTLNDLNHQIKELRQSYEALYNSQNSILKQTKLSTLFEVQEYLKNIHSNSPALKELEKINKMIPEESKLKKNIHSIIDNLKDSFEKTEKFMETLKRKL